MFTDAAAFSVNAPILVAGKGTFSTISQSSLHEYSTDACMCLFNCHLGAGGGQSNGNDAEGFDSTVVTSNASVSTPGAAGAGTGLTDSQPGTYGAGGDAGEGSILLMPGEGAESC